MAVLPFPSNSYPSLPLSSSSSSSTSSPPYFLFLQSQKHSAKRFGTLIKLRTPCSRQTIHVDTHQNDPPIKAPLGSVKKRRKPRPSFLQQIQDKWSLKLDSSRQKFPWQEPKEEEVAEEEHAQQQEQGSVQEVLDARISSKVSDVSSKGYNLAPWVLGYKPQSKNEARISQFSREDGEEIGGFGNNGGISVRETKISGYKDSNNGKFDKIDGDDVGSSMPIQSEKKRLDFGGNGALLSVNTLKDLLEVGEIEVEVSTDDIHVASTISINAERKSLALKVVDDALSDKESLGNTSNRDSIGLPWNVVDERKKQKTSKTYMAERTIPEHELRRLRNVALRMLERIKVGNGGITEALVESIHEKWKVDEVVKLKFESAPSVDMKRTHETLESRTGGLVIWRSGSSIVLFRGLSYKLPCVQSFTIESPSTAIEPPSPVRVERQHFASSPKHQENLSEEELKDMNDLNQLLDELGPRFMDWSGRGPVPVDADLLPSVVPDYKTPFRLLPYGVRLSLRNKEMTAFRRLARTTPPHFALGRNRRLQGLASAVVKLWERSAIAKIAIKRGVQNTSNDRMAEELKNLTGGTLLSRNKDFIVIYRGNDFLPPAVMNAVKERIELTNLQQTEEEQVRELASAAIITSKTKAASGSALLVAGTLKETLAATSRWGNDRSSEDVEQMRRDSSLDKHVSLVRSLQKKLSLAKRKVKKAEYALAKIQKNLQPSDLPSDLETVTDEERFLFRKMGLSMKPFLLVGRREVFDGTIQNMHLHWKHRELVKLIVRGQSFPQVKHLAISLEAESGGVLISLDKTTKGYAVILYRGKNYRQPQGLKPKNLLSKRQALARSIELQRREALKHHILDLQERIELLKSELENKRGDTKSGGDEDDDEALRSSSTESDLSDEDEGDLEIDDTKNEEDSGDEDTEEETIS